ncbi:dihydropyrimidine dehydrogenase [Clostridium carboxidivorans P7]|uniref:FAD-dependent pyridine nucleotide-disulphide oxidoreductase n=1 Tax=Clostridium carboxidivorans P7 TaxID=536227 RepID=C6PRE0_9CLOT|nr:NAD(P)-dependent oxidoreductase [Clostridium carboxidivorans]AKN31695.1 dihydropyrimidine dehydrogenase [Clostridium carboxidivorans P7]EET88240.1 FAD-dependent pyridine nucleotide-disulphide oxidoreductase [Clostridium carboxidivorans P7]EFG87481.1 pyridine nucleotide-disulfide oxidoreductase [Clostridium carboxidivorans P7]
METRKYLEETNKPLTPLLAMEEAARCLLCHDAPCSKACPAGTNPSKFIRSLRFRNFKGAVETIRTNNVLAGVCARVCPYDKYCEGACSRCGIDKPIRIGELQRYLTDYEKNINMKVLDKVEATKEKVAIIGAGPSGLSAAATLALRGYNVTVFEEKDILGGWLSYGIPPERLPQEVVEDEINYIKELGVEFKTNCKVGKDIKIDDLRSKGFKAFLISSGIQKGKAIDVKGADLEGVVNGVDFLGKAKTNKGDVKVGSHVIVIGGGDVAMDCASTAKLLGCEDVKIIYRRTIEKMPADVKEREYIQSLNIPIFTGFKPSEITGNGGNVASFKAEGMFDGSAAVELTADMIIFAVGQEPEDVKAIVDVKVDGKGIVATEDCRTNVSDVFAAGDIVEGDKTVVQAVALGKLAGESIDSYLAGIR